VDDADRQNQNIQIALIGLSALFTMVAIINTVVIAGSDRREELARLRLTGLSRSQVVRSALGESTVVVATGTVLGLVAASGSILGSSAVVSAYVEQRIVAVPLTVSGATAAVICAVVVATTWMTTRMASRRRPIDVAGARE
jgi:putative ABC transport system permease protein